MGAPFAFTLPPELSAKEPPERRGIRRDQVRLLVIERATGKIEHTRFDKIDSYLRQKDLLVFNSSRTRPAWPLHGSASGRALAGRFLAGASSLRAGRSFRLRIT